MEVKDLINQLNKVSSGRSQYVKEIDAYLTLVSGYRGVAIECDANVKIEERFNKVEVSNKIFTIKGQNKNVVFLCTKEEQMSMNYGMLCMDFLSSENRDTIIHNPIKWFEGWKNLLGNTRTDKMVFDVIGEMKVLLMLQQRGKNPTWMSTEQATFDIVADSGVYEVKTTKSRTESEVTIHNRFQLNMEELDDDLYLAFVRVERNDAGVSIDDLYNQLVYAGFNKDVLTQYLDKIGYYVGKSERYESYIIHQVDAYKVGDNFPRITKGSFVGGRFPKGVVKLEYTISLEGLEHTELI